MNAFRTERDFLGELQIPAASLHGIHTARALENFPLSSRPVPEGLARAYGTVKLACALTNRALGCWRDDQPKATAIEQACRELSQGTLVPHIVVDLLQGADREAALGEVKRWNPSGSFPTLVINDRSIVGFQEEKIREALR